jgi:hypothetical protein
VILPDDRLQICLAATRRESSSTGTSSDSVEKITLTIVWSRRGFHLINVLEEGRKFKVKHYVTEIFSPLSEWRPLDAPESDRKLIIHGDNARPHTARPSIEFFEDNRMKTALHPPYSPDSTPPDFNFFGYVQYVWPVDHLWMQKNFSKQFEKFLTASQK